MRTTVFFFFTFHFPPPSCGHVYFLHRLRFLSSWLRPTLSQSCMVCVSIAETLALACVPKSSQKTPASGVKVAGFGDMCAVCYSPVSHIFFFNDWGGRRHTAREKQRRVKFLLSWILPLRDCTKLDAPRDVVQTGIDRAADDDDGGDETNARAINLV